MIDELLELLDRQVEALRVQERRLRAVELVAAAEEQRFLSLALDELEAASEAVASLELTRVLALSVAGLSVDVGAQELIAAVTDTEARQRVQELVLDLREAVEAVAEARERATAVVSRSAHASRTRLDAAGAFAAY